MAATMTTTQVFGLQNLPIRVQRAAGSPSKVFARLPRIRSVRLSRPQLRTQCVASTGGKDDAVVEFAESVGLPTEEGLFGFKPFAEVWVGRLAMMGFIVSIVEEAITGRGTLQQIGFTTPSLPLLWTIIGLSTGASLAATAWTLKAARSGELSLRQLARYRSFLGMRNETADVVETARAMKLKGDFTSPDSMKKIQEAKSEGTAADRFLSGTDVSATNAAASELKDNEVVFKFDDVSSAQQTAVQMKERETSALPGPSVSLVSKADALEAMYGIPDDMAYAKQVELTNGRWAMLGFLAAIAVEAATANGIILQLVMWFKASGLLGSASGF